MVVEGPCCVVAAKEAAAEGARLGILLNEQRLEDLHCEDALVAAARLGGLAQQAFPLVALHGGDIQHLRRAEEERGDAQDREEVVRARRVDRKLRRRDARRRADRLRPGPRLVVGEVLRGEGGDDPIEVRGAGAQRQVLQ